jgi:outer membrane protein, heavy metal efflux system
MSNRVFIHIIFIALTYSSFASANCNPKSYEDVIKCAESESPEAKIIQQKKEATNELEGAASQFINPDFEIESLRKNSDKSETSAALLFNFSIGGKRSALKAEARAEKEKTSAEVELNFATLRLNVMKQMYQLSHLRSEILIEEESISTFNKIILQFSKRAALTPEQEVSISIFKMAISDHQLNLANLKNSYEEVLSNLIRITNLDKAQITNNLPNRKTNWEKTDSFKESIKSSPQLRFAEAELMLAKSQKEKSVADSFPDIKIGPIFKEQKDGAITENFTGIGLSMPLPLLTLNSSVRAYQSKKVIEAEMVLKNEAKKIEMTNLLLIQKYNNLLATLKNSPDKKTTEDRHNKIERLFFNGLVPGSLVIEAHRQLYDLEENRNKTELEAIETIGQIYILQNQFSGVIL